MGTGLRILVRLVVALLVVALLAGGLEIVAAESGEVVVLTTRDDAGRSRETRLWVVDDGSHTWLRSGSAKAGWYRQLATRPDVEVRRGEQVLRVRAVPEPGARERVNGLMRAKYGWADAYIGALFGRDDAIPIRLDPQPEP
jgi:hypothetical protein